MIPVTVAITIPVCSVNLAKATLARILNYNYNVHSKLKHTFMIVVR